VDPQWWLNMQSAYEIDRLGNLGAIRDQVKRLRAAG
jgi:plasmid maintenance system antidote protein VapI